MDLKLDYISHFFSGFFHLLQFDPVLRYNIIKIFYLWVFGLMFLLYGFLCLT